MPRAYCKTTDVKQYLPPNVVADFLKQKCNLSFQRNIEKTRINKAKFVVKGAILAYWNRLWK